MSASPSEKPKRVEKSKRSEMVRVELCSRGGVDVLGEPDAPLLVKGLVGEFTPTEARELLRLTNRHGTPICRIVQGSHQ